MQDFTFWNPTKIVFGAGAVSKLGEEAKPFGKKALLVYGQSSIKKSGLHGTVTSGLRAAGLEVVEFPGVKANPVLSHARRGIALAKEQKVDLVVAVGGGSVLDEGKGIAAGAVTDMDVWEFYRGSAAVQSALPVVTVLTLPATGSEMNGGTVLTDEETGDKFGFLCQPLHPKVSLLDPTLTLTVPPNYTAYSAVDAISHLLEGYFTTSDDWTPIHDRYVEGLVKSIMESTERNLANPRDYQARATFMWCATLAWNGLGLAGLGAVELPNHLLEHPLSGLYDVAHGAGLSIVIPAWMTYASKTTPRKFAQFGRNVFGVKAKADAAAAAKGIAALKAWFEKIGSPTSFAAARIPAGDIEKITANTLRLAQAWGLQKYTREIIIEVYRLCV